MNLEKLFATQKKLDDRIEKEHPELRGKDNLDWKILALQTEIGECANEWRGFKKWSNDQKPRTKTRIYQDCKTCNGVGYHTHKNGITTEDCMDCEGEGQFIVGYKNPLLEEYVDCLHFILSIGLEKKKFVDFEMELKATFDDLIVYKDETITKQFNNLFLEVGLLYDATHDSAYAFKNEFESYSNVFSYFIGLGEMLGFTWEQIEQAYFAKNKVNHQRQEDGY